MKCPASGTTTTVASDSAWAISRADSSPSGSSSPVITSTGEVTRASPGRKSIVAATCWLNQLSGSGFHGTSPKRFATRRLSSSQRGKKNGARLATSALNSATSA